MVSESSAVEASIDRARGNGEDLGRLLERYRPLLTLESRRRMGRRLAARLRPSDVVQKTLVEAMLAFPEFRGESEREFSAWVLRIHQRNIADLTERYVQGATPASRSPRCQVAEDLTDWAACPTSPYLASAHDRDGSIRLWTGEGKLAEAFHAGHVADQPALAWDPHGSKIVSAGRRTWLRLWDVREKAPLATIVTLPEKQSIVLGRTGEILHADPQTLDRELIYVVQRPDGRADLLRPSEFRKRAGEVARGP